MTSPIQDATLHRAAVRAYGPDATYEVTQALHGWRGRASSPRHWREVEVCEETEAEAVAKLLGCLRVVGRRK